MKAAEQQAEADGSSDENPECPQLSLSVGQITMKFKHDIENMVQA